MLVPYKIETKEFFLVFIYPFEEIYRVFLQVCLSDTKDSSLSAQVQEWNFFCLKQLFKL